MPLPGSGRRRRFRRGQTAAGVNRECAIVLVGDTNRFSIQSLRIHVTDFFLHPLDRTRVERSVDRALGR